MSRIITIFLLLMVGCGRNEGPSGQYASGTAVPLITVCFRQMPSSEEIPWELRSGRGDISAAVMLEEEPDPSGWIAVLDEARSSGLLAAVVTDRDHGLSLGSDDIVIWTDSNRQVHAVPSGISSQLPSTMSLDSVKYHGLILDIFSMYRPDIVFLDLNPGSTGFLKEIARFWTSPEVLSSYRIALYSLGDAESSRGWCAFAGRGINGDIPLGVTESGLFSTIRLLAGLKWSDRLPGSVPALSILEDPRRIWGNL